MNDLKDFVCLTSHCKCNSKCDDCSECENQIDNWLEGHDKQIRAEAIEKIKEHFMKVFDEEQNRIRANWTNADIRETIWFELEQMKKGAENE